MGQRMLLLFDVIFTAFARSDLNKTLRAHSSEAVAWLRSRSGVYRLQTQSVNATDYLLQQGI